MKKIAAAVLALSLASPVMAGVGVDFGTNWYRVSYTDNVGDHLFGQGQNFLVYWTLDNGLTLGSYTEAGTWAYYSGNTDTWELTAIQINKEVVKNVGIGTNIGRIYTSYGGYDTLLIDLFASVTLLGGTGDKVSGALKAGLGARYAKDNTADYDFTGALANLTVGLSF